MESLQLKQVKKGEYITLKEIESPKNSQVWIKGDYDRSSKEYELSNFNDMNRTRYIKGDRLVYIDFTF